jgi:hypothetical protein
MVVTLAWPSLAGASSAATGPSADTDRRSWKLKRWPSAFTCFAITCCQIAEKPAALYRLPFLVRLMQSPGICGASFFGSLNYRPGSGLHLISTPAPGLGLLEHYPCICELVTL